MIIVLGSIKGGTGKSTISTNLTSMRSAAGKKVLLVDADEQQSSTMWTNRRLSLGINTPWTTIQLSGSLLRMQIEKMRPDYDDIIIDVGSRQIASFRSAIACCNLLLLPFKPRFFDIETLSNLTALINEMIPSNPNIKIHAVINQADARGLDNQESIDTLKKCPEMQCIDFTIGNRKSFSNAVANGKGVAELKGADKKSIMEMQQLYEFVFKDLVK